MSEPIDFIALARGHGLVLVPESVRTEDIGLDFAVAFANDESGEPWVLRVPRRPDAWPGAENEARFLRLVAPRLPVSVPEWVVADPSLIADRRVPGVPLIAVARTITGGFDVSWRIEPIDFPDSLVSSLAELVAALQAIEAPEGFVVPTPAERRANVAERIERARAATEIHPGRLAAWQRWLEDDQIWADTSVLAHGELHPLHLLLAEQGTPRVVGVLDWTEAAFTDPAVDFSIFYKSFGEAVSDRILARFEAITKPRPRFREHALHWQSLFPVNLLEYASRSGDEGYLAQARADLAAGE